jgi:hypothetical protein
MPRLSKEDNTYNARSVLYLCHCPIGGDFHRLSTSHVEALLVEADKLKYRKPANANGSRARYFHDMLQRRAGSKT